VDPVIIRPKTKKSPQVANPPIAPEVTIMCEACRSFTLHKFVIVRRAGMASFEQIYACSCCKAERRFGLLA